MSLLYVVGLVMAQAPAAVQPGAAPAPAARKQKPRQICEYIEITGSRSKRRVCRDAEGSLDLGPGVSNNAFGKAKIDQQNVGTGGQASAQ